jgi:hypothetical protein
MASQVARSRLMWPAAKESLEFNFTSKNILAPASSMLMPVIEKGSPRRDLFIGHHISLMGVRAATASPPGNQCHAPGPRPQDSRYAGPDLGLISQLWEHQK